jgi:hypothetical protein
VVIVVCAVVFTWYSFTVTLNDFLHNEKDVSPWTPRAGSSSGFIRSAWLDGARFCASCCAGKILGPLG